MTSTGDKVMMPKTSDFNLEPAGTADEFEEFDKAITAHSSRIVVVSRELRALHSALGSLTGNEIVDALCNDVNVQLTTLEVLQAKRRELEVEYSRLLSAVTTLKDALMTLREQSYLEEEKPRVSLPKNLVTIDVEAAKFAHNEPAPLADGEFDPDALRNEMEKVVNEGRKRGSLFRSGK
jgi:hypothetical protein